MLRLTVLEVEDNVGVGVSSTKARPGCRRRWS